jgi:nitrogenase-associated protein
MVDIIFYEKPGCINNARQKKLLRDAGHQLDCRNLLLEKWSDEALLPYFITMPVSMWFNKSAPDIKSGEIDILTIGKNEALELMVKNPILIRRPLMRVGDDYQVGFDIKLVNEWIGLTVESGKKDLESCPKEHGDSCEISVKA